MDKKSTDLADSPAFNATEELVSILLKKGISAPEISFALAFVATDLGLQMAPSAEHAIAVVTDAIRQTATTYAYANSQAESDSNAEAHGDEAVAVDPEITSLRNHIPLEDLDAPI